MANHCTANTDYYEFLNDGEFMNAVTCPLIDGMGGGLVGETLLMGMVFGGLGISFAIYSRSVKPLIIMSIFGSTMIIPRLPATAQQFAGIIIVLMIALAGYVLWRRAEGIT